MNLDAIGPAAFHRNSVEKQTQREISSLRADLNRIGAEVQKLLLIPGLQEVAEVPARTIPGTPARYELKKK